MRRNNHRAIAPMPAGQVPMLGQGPSREQQAQIALRQMMGQMSSEIYSRLAVTHISGGEESRESLMELAKKSHLAAEAYFEGLGIISREQ